MARPVSPAHWRAGGMAPHGFADLPVLQDWHDQRTAPRPQACGVEACGARLIKKYHLKHRLCPQHCKCLAVLRRGVPQRWCAQCNVFHTLDAFFATQGCAPASRLGARSAHPTLPPFVLHDSSRLRCMLQLTSY